MSQTAITLAFEQWKAQQAATGEPVLLDEFVFALVPGLDPDLPVDRSETLPPAAQIVHRESVARKGVVNENAVVHSAVLGADVGDFSFNWIGLTNKATGTLAMIVHAPEQQKLKTKEGQQGNVLTRSFLMEFTGAQTETAINTPAETWQIDFTARMAGMDERQRLENIDLYGTAAFLGDGWLVGKTGNQYFVTKGAGYVSGLRAVLAANQNITVTTKPVKVWLDVCWTGALTSVWAAQSKVTVAANLTDYELNGVKHYVFALASVDANGIITDLRPKGTLSEQAASDALAKHEKSRNHPDATTSEKGFTQLSSETGSDSESRAATPKAVKTVNDDLQGVKKTLGTAAAGDVTTSPYDTFAGRLLKVGDYGWGNQSGTRLLDSLFDIQCSAMYSALGAGSATATEGMPENSGNTRFIVMATNVYVDQFWITLISRDEFYTGLLNTSNKTVSWTKYYNTANKPAASDVDAVSASQGGTFQKPVQFNQPAYFAQGVKLANSDTHASIGYGADAASFTNANLLLKSWYGIGFYSTYPSGGELGVMGYVDVRIGRLAMKEQVIPGNYTNFDARYQAKGSYTPAGQAYTKAESDARYNLKNTASKGGNGWQKDSSTGVIIQFGSGSYTHGSRVTFPTAFPNFCLSVVGNDTGTGIVKVSLGARNTTGFTMYSEQNSVSLNWIAIGY